MIALGAFVFFFLFLGGGVGRRQVGVSYLKN